jgi:hypothetical protein
VTNVIRVALVASLVLASCNQGLSDAESVWCGQHYRDVLAASAVLYGGDAAYWWTYFGKPKPGRPVLSLNPDDYWPGDPDTFKGEVQKAWQRSCRAAYEAEGH